MTAKQRAARANFKAVQAEAKKLRGKNKKLSQAQAVKQAWAIMKSKGKLGATLLIEKGETKRTKPKNVIQITRTKGGQFKKVKAVGAVPGAHKDTKSHNVNIRVLSGVKKKLGALPGYNDEHAAEEIRIYADNNSQLYFSRKLPIIKNLYRKWKKGSYDISKAAKLWQYYIEDAMQRYNKEHGSRGDKWYELLTPGDRKVLAREYAEFMLKEFELGAYDDSILKS